MNRLLPKVGLWTGIVIALAGVAAACSPPPEEVVIVDPPCAFEPDGCKEKEKPEPTPGPDDKPRCLLPEGCKKADEPSCLLLEGCKDEPKTTDVEPQPVGPAIEDDKPLPLEKVEELKKLLQAWKGKWVVVWIG